MLDDHARVGDAVVAPLDFSSFYREQRPAVVRLATALLGSRDAAEELTQEAFSRVMTRFDSLDNPAGYVRTTVVNLARTARGRDRRGHARAHLLYRDVEVPGPPIEVLDALAKLPYRQRAVLVLRYWADWTERDIADALGVKAGTVKSLAARSLERLRAELGEQP